MEKEVQEKEENPKPYHYYEQRISRRIHHFYISSPIHEPHLYVDFIHKLNTSTSDEVIHIHLNTPGGQLHTGVQIINAIQNCSAHVICSIEAEVASLGTLIFLSADEYIVNDNTMMMFHNFSGGTHGKGHEQQSMLTANIKWFEKLARDLYIPFLSQEEFDRIIRGEDLYFHSDEIKQRLKKLIKTLSKNQPNATKNPRKHSPS